MFSGIVHAHSGLRWILLILLVFTTLNAFKKWKNHEAFTALDNQLSLLTLIFAHLQLVIGFYLYFTSAKVNLSSLDMANAIMRFFTVEHLVGMLIAIVLITLGRIQSKKITTPALKHKKIFVLFFIALLIILLSIPWPFRGVGGAWF